MVTWPTGTVTFLFTDIESSTVLWEQHRDAMRLTLVHVSVNRKVDLLIIEKLTT